MASVSPDKLRESAYHYRSMAVDGDDMHLKAALLQLADDFDQEAADLEAHLATLAPSVTPAPDVRNC
jgi:hypothetical protein